MEKSARFDERQLKRPHSAENKVKFKTLLNYMVGDDWLGALGRLTNLEEASPELSQIDVNIQFLF